MSSLQYLLLSVQDQLTHSTLIPSESPVRSYGSYEPTEYMRNLFSEESTLSFSAPVESQVEQSDSIHISPEDEPVVISDTVSTRSPEHARVIESSITTSEVLIVASDLEATQEVMPSPLVDNSSTSITIESTTSQEYGSIETFRREEPMPYHFEFTQQSLPPFFAVNQIPDEHPATSTQLNIDSLPEEPFLANEDVITVTTSFRTEEEHSPVMDQPLESLPVAAPFKPSELEERFKSIAKGLGDETNVHLHLQRQAILQLKKVIPLVRTEQEEKMLLDVLPKLYRWVSKRHVSYHLTALRWCNLNVNRC